MMKYNVRFFFISLACLWIASCSSSTIYTIKKKATNLETTYQSKPSINFLLETPYLIKDVTIVQQIIEKIIVENKLFESYQFLVYAWDKGNPNADFDIRLKFFLFHKQNPGFFNLLNIIVSGTTLGLFPVFVDESISLDLELRNVGHVQSIYQYHCSERYIGAVAFFVAPNAEPQVIEIEIPTYVIENLVKDALFKLITESPLKEFNESNK